MTSTIITLGEKKKSLKAGAIALSAGAIAAILGTIDVRFGFVPIFLVALVWATRALGLSMTMPRDRFGWLYAGIVFMACWAPSLGGIGTILRFLLAVVALVMLLTLARNKECQPMHVSVKIGATILGVALLASTISAASAAYGLARFLNWIMFLPLLWLAYYRPSPRGVVFGLAATGLFQMAGVALQMAGILKGTWGGLLTSGQTYNPETSSWLTRYTGFIQNPNNLALILSCGFVALATCLMADIPVRLKGVCLVLMALFGAGIVATGSRGGLVAVGIGLVALFMAAGKRGIALGMATVAAGFTLLQIAGSREIWRILESFGEILSGSDASAAQRSSVWTNWFRSSDETDLVVGTGFGGYARRLFADQHGLDIDPIAARLATVDNGWLKLLLESGLLGVIGMGILFFWPMVGSLLKSTGQLRLVGLGAGACIVAILWRSLSVDMLDQNPWNAVIFLALGTAAASWTSDCKSTIPSASKVDKLILSTPKSQPLLRQQSARYGTGRFVGHHGRQTGF